MSSSGATGRRGVRYWLRASRRSGGWSGHYIRRTHWWDDGPLTEYHHELINRHAYLLGQCVNKARGHYPWVHPDDLLGEAHEGMIKAALTYDADQSSGFAGYAWVVIHRAINRLFGGKLRTGFANGQYRRKPRIVSQELTGCGELASLHGDRKSYASPAPLTDYSYRHAENSVAISRALEVLNERERSIVCRSFGCEDDLVSIGAGIGVCGERARQLRIRSLERAKRAAQGRRQKTRDPVVGRAVGVGRQVSSGHR